MKKPTPFSAFLEPVRRATHLNSAPSSPSGTTTLIALLALILVRSLAIPESACAAITYADRGQPRPLRLQQGEHDQRADLKHQPAIQGDLQSGSRGDPSTQKIGDDAEEFVEQKQERDLDGAVAKTVEMQQHQHPQRAVGEREAPVGPGDQRVVAHG